MRYSLFAAAMIVAELISIPASAQVVSDNFDGENGGVSYLNYGTAGGTSFTNFNVTQGRVDLVRSGDFGISCAGGSGSCIDLEGTGPGATNGKLTSKQTYAFAIGDVVNVSFLLSGNQRPNFDPNGDHFQFVIDFANASVNNPVIMNDLTVIDGTLTYFTPTQTTFFSYGYGSGTIAATAPFLLRSFTFTAGTAGAFTFSIQGDDLAPTPQPNDDYGLILDNVSVTVGPRAVAGVPEPATWAMMVVGFGLLGGVLRRRGAITTTVHI